MRWQSFFLPKRGHSADEFEDAFAGDPVAGRFAIADGAAESSFAALWARLLVEAFVTPGRELSVNGSWLAPLQQRWAADVDGLTIPWYGEAKRSDGAFATFLGLVVTCADQYAGGTCAGGTWRGAAVGDSCLFHVSEDGIQVAFPVCRAADFGNRPALLGSRSDARTCAVRAKEAWGTWQSGDRLLLMTDALAQWFLAEAERGQQPWFAIEELQRFPNRPDALRSWLEDLRDRGSLRNDDVTLLVIDL
ncbi:MAG: protein phosphatase 2C domain-containing protein [Gemmataceae bacterium]|nr:protein phosphatase 2C domain-containing protein [Gemmataceae bacterium]